MIQKRGIYDLENFKMIGSGLYYDTLLTDYQNGHIRKSINQQKRTVIAPLG
jgi:hypothetical protein